MTKVLSQALVYLFQNNFCTVLQFPLASRFFLILKQLDCQNIVESEFWRVRPSRTQHICLGITVGAVLFVLKHFLQEFPYGCSSVCVVFTADYSLVASCTHFLLDDWLYLLSITFYIHDNYRLVTSNVIQFSIFFEEMQIWPSIFHILFDRIFLLHLHNSTPSKDVQVIRQWAFTFSGKFHICVYSRTW